MIIDLFKKKPLQEEIFVPNGIALRGYDPVAYFENKKMKGSKLFSIYWKGAEWKFSSKDHLNQFKTNPSSFCP